MAQEVGFEPTTSRLTAGCSTTELLLNRINSQSDLISLNLNLCLHDRVLIFKYNFLRRSKEYKKPIVLRRVIANFIFPQIRSSGGWPLDSLYLSKVTGRSLKQVLSVFGGNTEMIKLRTYVFIDSLQPQLAMYLGTTSQGFLPIPGDASLWIETAPGMAIHRLTDASLKSTKVRLGQQVVERSFGTLEVHHEDQGEVRQAGEAVLRVIEQTVDQRQKCRIAWHETIRGIEPDHAVVINRQGRKGSMITPGMSMFILETDPAGYIVLAANEAEKAANITLVDVRAFGAFGRLTIVGREADVDEAAKAAMSAVNNLTGRDA